MANVAVFLDRDDTIIEDPGYISDPAQIKLLGGVVESLRRLQKMGFKLIVVTNQSAVARGIVSEEVLEQIHERLQNLLIRRRIHLDAIYYCPYHPEGVIAKYRRESDFRKPGPGMLLQAAEDMDIDLEHSWMLGNSYSDITAGANAGCRTILISSSAKLPTRKRDEAKPDNTAANIKEAVNIIKMFQRENLVAAARRTGAAESVAETEEGPSLESTVQLPAEVEPQGEPASEAQVEESAEVSAPTEDEQPAAESETQTQQDQSAETTPAETPSEGVGETENAGRQVLLPGASWMTTGSEKPAGRGKSDSPASDSPDTPPVLQEVLRYLKKMDRMNMYDEFSLMKVLAGVVQMVIVFLLLLSIWFLMDPTRDEATVHTVLGYAGVLQLMVIAFHMMRDRK